MLIEQLRQQGPRPATSLVLARLLLSRGRSSGPTAAAA